MLASSESPFPHMERKCQFPWPLHALGRRWLKGIGTAVACLSAGRIRIQASLSAGLGEVAGASLILFPHLTDGDDKMG